MDNFPPEIKFCEESVKVSSEHNTPESTRHFNSICRFLLNWCEPGFCSASVSKYCFSPSDRVRCNFLSFYVAKTVSVLVFSIDNSAGQGPMPGLEHYDYEHSSNASEDEKIFIKLFYYFTESFCGKNV